MILIDVNVLVYAYRAESDRHDAAASWMAETLAGNQEVGVLDLVLAGFVRISTNPRIFEDPSPTADALGFVDAILQSPKARWISSSSVTWQIFHELVESDRGIRGNLVPDAYLAAAAIASGARLATCDLGFARFPRLDWFDPLR